jgi:hypothetical protein
MKENESGNCLSQPASTNEQQMCSGSYPSPQHVLRFSAQSTPHSVRTAGFRAAAIHPTQPTINMPSFATMRQFTLVAHFFFLLQFMKTGTLAVS